MTAEEREILGTCRREVTMPVDHPAWPVECGECKKRCHGAQIRFIRKDRSRGVGVTVWVCRACKQYGAVASDYWSDEDISVVKRNIRHAGHFHLLFAGLAWSKKLGLKLPADGTETLNSDALTH